MNPIIKALLNLFSSAVLIIILVYIGLTLILFFSQSRFIYYPFKQIEVTPQAIGLKYEDIFIKTNDQIEISAWFIPAENARATVLICHGNAGNISHRLDTIKIFNDLMLNVLIFDYRGYGKSKGKISEKGSYLDAESAWNFLVKEKNLKPKEIIIFGRSLGAAISTNLAQKHTPKMLILESALTSVVDMAKSLYPFLPVKLLCRFKYNTINYIKNVKCPVLIIHSPNDEIIPYSHGEKLFNTANEPKEFLEISGRHNEGFIDSGQYYIEGLNEFITKELKQKKGDI